MTAALPGLAPVNDDELIVAMNKRIRKLETANTLRVGPWVISNDVETGNLLASRPGQAVVIDNDGATQEVDARSVDLSGLVTSDELAAAVGDGGSVDVPGMITSAFGDLYHKLTGLLNPVDALSGLANFFRVELGGLISSARLPLIPLANIRNVNPNLLVDGSFTDEMTLAAFTDWDYDEADGKSAPGAAYTVADGNTHTFRFPAIEVGSGDELDLAVWVRWLSLTSTSGSIRLAVSSYTDADVLIGTGPVVVASTSGAGTSAWTRLSADGWDVPAAADHVVVELTVGAGASAGVVKFDDASARKTGSFPQSYVSGLVGALQSAAQRVQDVINNIWTGITRQILDGPKGLPDIFDVLGNIPPFSIGGVGGLANIAETINETWNQLWGGFAQIINGKGKSIADAANAANNVSGKADNAQQLSVWNNAILELRNNKSLMEGMDETSESNFLLSDLLAGTGEPPIVAATAAAVPMSFWRGTETAQKGFISWYGKGVANITALYIDLYRLNPATATWELFHTSPNQINQFPADGSWKLGLYYMDKAYRFQVNSGDLIGVAWRVTGTGTHSVAGKMGGWLPSDPSTIPAKPGATRTGSGNITSAALTYSGNVGWFGIGIVSGDVPPPYYAPRLTEVSAEGPYVYDIPVWANVIEALYLGAGGGGRAGNTVNTAAGEGGDAGVWVTETLVRGVDFPDLVTQLSVTVGTGGAGGTSGASGKAGTATVRGVIANGKAAVTAAGGAGGNRQDNTEGRGDSPGNMVYGTPPQQYLGGGTASAGRNGSPGSPAGGGGGGGYGGTYGIGFNGGAGARGGAWFRAKQS